MPDFQSEFIAAVTAGALAEPMNDMWYNRPPAFADLVLFTAQTGINPLEVNDA